MADIRQELLARFADPFVRAMAVLSLTAFVLSLVVYEIALLAGQLPTPEQWFDVQRNNHGPWRWTPPGMLVGWPFYVLIPVTVFGGSLRAWRFRETRVLSGTVWLTLMQMGALYIQLRVMFWTVD